MKNASSYFSRSSCLRKRLLMSTVPGASNRDRTNAPLGLRASPSNHCTSSACRLQMAITASRVSGIWRSPHSSAARSMSGKVVVARFLPDANQ